MFGEPRTINVSGNALYIEYVENNYVNGNGNGGARRGTEVKVPDELHTEQASLLLTNLVKHRVLDEHFQPLELSTSESAVLAYQMCSVLSINDVWRVFSVLWGRTPNALRAAYNRGMEQKKTLKFLDEINPFLAI